MCLQSSTKVEQLDEKLRFHSIKRQSNSSVVMISTETDRPGKNNYDNDGLRLVILHQPRIDDCFSVTLSTSGVSCLRDILELSEKRCFPETVAASSWKKVKKIRFKKSLDIRNARLIFLTK